MVKEVTYPLLAAATAVIILGLQPSYAAAQNQNRQQNSDEASSNSGQQQQGVSLQAAKANIGPKSIELQTALQSAINQVHGLRVQLEQVPASSKVMLDQVKFYKNNLQNDLKVAKDAQNKINSQVKNYPQIADSNAAKMMQSTFSNLEAFNKSWTSRASDDKYWLNRAQALNDLKALGDQLTQAIDGASSFNSGQLALNLKATA